MGSRKVKSNISQKHNLEVSVSLERGADTEVIVGVAF